MRVVIAEDQVIYREGLIRLLTKVGYEVVADCADAGELLRQVEQQRPDAALIDLRLPPTRTNEGVVAAIDIRRRHPGTAVLVLTASTNGDFAEDLFHEFSHHVGYIIKDSVTTPATIKDFVERVAAGELVMDPAIVSYVIGRTSARSKLAALTKRERTVLQLMAQGYVNAAIARELCLSPRSVEDHCSAIFRKLQLSHSMKEEGDLSKRVLAILLWLKGQGAP